MIDNPFENRTMEPSIYLSKEDARMAGIGQRYLGDKRKSQPQVRGLPGL